jgi:hypothetical protein
MVIFHSYGTVYQRVTWQKNHRFNMAKNNIGKKPPKNGDKP